MKLKCIKSSMLYQKCLYQSGTMKVDHLSGLNDLDKVHPEQDLLLFYLGAEVLALVEDTYGIDTELPSDIEEVVILHHNHMISTFKRLFTYLILISVGESRHGNIDSHTNYIKDHFGKDIVDFSSALSKAERRESRKIFLSKPRNLRAYMEYLEWNFKNTFCGDVFGGTPWYSIAHKVTQVLKGEISPYTMVDMSWALVHNSGSIFNKGTIYNRESCSGTLEILLDFQRAGAIGSLAHHYPTYLTKLNLELPEEVTKLVLEVFNTTLTKFPEAFPLVSIPTIKKAGALSTGITCYNPPSEILVGSAMEYKLEYMNTESFGIGDTMYKHAQRVKV